MAEGVDSKQAEKTYLSRTGGRVWERDKPFPPAGTEMFTESIELLNDFVVAMRLLQPGPDDRILDLGAGGGWCSHLLQRLNRKAVAVDIAHEMLAVNRAPAEPGSYLLKFDLVAEGLTWFEPAGSPVVLRDLRVALTGPEP